MIHISTPLQTIITWCLIVACMARYVYQEMKCQYNIMHSYTDTSFLLGQLQLTVSTFHTFVSETRGAITHHTKVSHGSFSISVGLCLS